MVSKGCILSSACASITIRSNSYSGGLGCCSYDLCNRSSVGTTPSLLSILLLPFACLVHISWMFPNVPWHDNNRLGKVFFFLKDSQNRHFRIAVSSCKEKHIDNIWHILLYNINIDTKRNERLRTFYKCGKAVVFSLVTANQLYISYFFRFTHVTLYAMLSIKLFIFLTTSE